MSGSASTSSCRASEFPRSPLFYDPVLTLTWVAAVTERVRLGTTVLVLPMRHPLPLAKELATLHNLSDGRLILGAGVGWLEPEFAALGVPFQERGRRMDEGIAMMRAVWTQDPVTFEAKYIPAKIIDMTMTPLPISHDPAVDRRQLGRGAEAHRSASPTAGTAAARRRRRRRRSCSGCARRGRSGFTISMRMQWNGKDQGELRERLAAYEAVGVQHVLVAPENREVDDWDEVIEGAGRMVAG